MNRTASPPLTILHLVAPAPVGGLERVVHALAAGHRRSGHRVHVAAVLETGGEDHPLCVALGESGVEVHPLALPARSYRRERREVDALCRRIRPDVVHTHGYRVDVLDAGIPRRLGVPVVSTVHGATGGDLKNRFYEWLQRRAFRRFDGVVAVSRTLAAELAASGVPGGRLHLVPNAWSDRPRGERAAAREALGAAPDERIVGWVGRLSREKGVDVLVDALARIDAPRVAAAVVGDGAEGAAARARARAAGLGDRIRWTGFLADADRLFPAFDVFVLSSRTEGTPIVLFEAMAAGVPIVATRVGGVPDVVSDAEAVLVPPEDPAALAAAIERVLADPAAAAERARAARARLRDRFSLEPWLARYEETYRQLLPPSHPGSRSPWT